MDLFTASCEARVSAHVQWAWLGYGPNYIIQSMNVTAVTLPASDTISIMSWLLFDTSSWRWRAFALVSWIKDSQLGNYDIYE